MRQCVKRVAIGDVFHNLGWGSNGNDTCARAFGRGGTDLGSEQLSKVLEILASRLRDPNATIAETRAGMERVSERLPSDVKCEAVKAGGVPAQWIVPPGASAERVILYLHGGGYTMGSSNTHRAMIARIAQASNARALAIDYRLAPENPFPAAVEDAVAGYRWLLSEGHSPGRIIIAGDSAGGGLTLAALAALRDEGVPMPAGGVPISPWTDLEGSGESVRSRANRDPMIQPDGLVDMAKMYLGEQDARNPLASPLYADFRGFPPLLVQVGDAEILLDDATRVAARAREAGVQVELEVWEDMIHVWHAFAKLLPEGQEAIDRIGRFVAERAS
jgi:monoterpene epsilon-lactone hydrolase